MLFNGNHDLLTSGQSKNLTCKSFCVEVKPLGNRSGSVSFNCCLNLCAFLALILDSDFIAGLKEIGRNVDLLAVYFIVTVSNKLSCFCSGVSPAKKINNVVKAAFADTKKVFTCYALLTLSHEEILVELAFLNTVITLSLLLCAKLKTVFRKASSTSISSWLSVSRA